MNLFTCGMCQTDVIQGFHNFICLLCCLCPTFETCCWHWWGETLKLHHVTCLKNQSNVTVTCNRVNGVFLSALLWCTAPSDGLNLPLQNPIITNTPHFTSSRLLQVQWVYENTDTRGPALQCGSYCCANKCKTRHPSKSLVTVSPAVKRCRPSPGHFHASKLYDHIHSHDLS